MTAPNNENLKAATIPVDGATLGDVLLKRAAIAPDDVAYTFLVDGAADARSITWGRLARRAVALGESLKRQGATGKPVLLALPSGLGFVESLFACWHAGAITVPVSLPRHARVKHRLDATALDAGATFAMGSAETRQRLVGDGEDPAGFGRMIWTDSDSVVDDPNVSLTDSRAAVQRVALLQYTSGSTGVPRGVVVTHANLMHNTATIADACGGQHEGHPVAGWLPLFHDMGLIGLVIQSVVYGVRCVFMAPERFLMRPWQWLQMISDYRARFSPAPNFAYDLCVDKVTAEHKAKLDLGSWKYAFNGSEPVRGATLDRFVEAFGPCGFKRQSFYPCYGLAESTLLVTGPGPDEIPSRRDAEGTLLPKDDTTGHVGCGRTIAKDSRLVIVDPATSRKLSDGQIGEIWVSSGSVTDGYWNNAEATAAAFNATLADDTEHRRWLRSGDLGFVSNGELFITGRLRDLIIIAGRNVFPIDVERTTEASDPSLAPTGSAAFSVDVDGVERLVVVAEVKRELARRGPGDGETFDADGVRRRIKAAVALESEATPHDVVLLKPGALQRTTSGKVARRAMREAYLNQTLERWEGAPEHVRVTR